MISIADMRFEEWIDFMFTHQDTFIQLLKNKGYNQQRIKEIYANADAHRMYPKEAEVWDKSPRCGCPEGEQISSILDIGTRYRNGHKQVMTIDFCVLCNKEVGTRRDWSYIED